VSHKSHLRLRLCRRGRFRHGHASRTGHRSFPRFDLFDAMPVKRAVKFEFDLVADLSVEQ
jgi:hypothetical protein